MLRGAQHNRIDSKVLPLFLAQGDVEAGEEAKFGVGGCEVVDDAEAVLFCDIGGLDACFFAYFAAYGCKGVGVCRTCITCITCITCCGCVEVAFEEAADDVITSGVDVYALSFVEEDVVVGCFDDGADGEGVA